MDRLQPFEVHIDDAALADLDRRLDATRWIEDVFDGDWRFGAPLPFVRTLCHYWRHEFDWRGFEARINRESHVTTEIDGLTIHAMQRRSERGDAVPLLMLHGWPSSFLDFLDLCDPLAAPPGDMPAFHVVTPSLPGYGFSSVKPGVTPQRIAQYFVTLMERLGYPRFMVQGGDWGSLVGTEIARQYPERVIGLHLNVINGSPPPDADSSTLSPQEQLWAAELGNYLSYPHLVLNAQQPASLAHALNDSPAGLAAWIGEKIYQWSDGKEPEESVLSRDAVIATIALYWFTGTSGSSARLYYEATQAWPEERFVTVPTAGALFPREVVKLPRSWAARHYNIVQWSVFERGGHFPALETPDLLVGDLRRFAGALAG